MNESPSHKSIIERCFTEKSPSKIQSIKNRVVGVASSIISLLGINKKNNGMISGSMKQMQNQFTLPEDQKSKHEKMQEKRLRKFVKISEIPSGSDQQQQEKIQIKTGIENESHFVVIPPKNKLLRQKIIIYHQKKNYSNSTEQQKTKKLSQLQNKSIRLNKIEKNDQSSSELSLDFEKELQQQKQIKNRRKTQRKKYEKYTNPDINVIQKVSIMKQNELLYPQIKKMIENNKNSEEMQEQIAFQNSQKQDLKRQIKKMNEKNLRTFSEYSKFNIDNKQKDVEVNLKLKKYFDACREAKTISLPQKSNPQTQIKSSIFNNTTLSRTTKNTNNENETDKGLFMNIKNENKVSPEGKATPTFNFSVPLIAPKKESIFTPEKAQEVKVSLQNNSDKNNSVSQLSTPKKQKQAQAQKKEEPIQVFSFPQKVSSTSEVKISSDPLNKEVNQKKKQTAQEQLLQENPFLKSNKKSQQLVLSKIIGNFNGQLGSKNQQSNLLFGNPVAPVVNKNELIMGNEFSTPRKNMFEKQPQQQSALSNQVNESFEDDNSMFDESEHSAYRPSSITVSNTLPYNFSAIPSTNVPSTNIPNVINMFSNSPNSYLSNVDVEKSRKMFGNPIEMNQSLFASNDDFRTKKTDNRGKKKSKEQRIVF